MSEPTSQSVASQFTIKRLLWTLIVASVAFKLADVTGVLSVATNNWEFARGNHRFLLIASLLAFGLIVLIYIAWIGIRLPFLVERYFEIRNKRQRRKEEYRREFESWRSK